MSDFLETFLVRMRSMGRHPDKNIINELTLQAGDVKSNSVVGVSAEDLTGAVESALLRAPPSEKLPIIYLMDSIMFNVRGNYPAMFAQQLPSLFMDAMRNVDDVTKVRLRRLVTAWEKRMPNHGGLPSQTLGEINRRLNPDFNVAKFVRDQEHKFGLLSRGLHTRNLQKFPQQSLHQHQAPPQQRSHGGHSPLYQQHGQFPEEVLREYAARILDEMQGGLRVAPADRLRLDDLGTRPELLRQVYDQARQELGEHAGQRIPTPVPHLVAAAPQHVSSQHAPSQHALSQHAPSQHAPPQHTPPPLASPQCVPPQHAPPPLAPPPLAPPPLVSPTLRLPAGLSSAMNAMSQQQQQHSPSAGSGELNWSSDWLGRSDGVDAVVRRLYHGCAIAGAYIDPLSRLSFDSQAALDAFVLERAQQLFALNASLPSNKEHAAEFRCRNWLIRARDWERGMEQVLTVKGAGFDDDNGDNNSDGLARRESLESLVSVSDRYMVPVDESQKVCALTGTEFEKGYDDDEGQWIYKDAIRPDPNGPIFIASAYLKEQAKRKRGGDSGDARDCKMPRTN